MFDPKITKGKWKLKHWKTEPGTEFCNFEDEKGELIRWGRVHKDKKPEYIANGQAIEEVPQLLEVLKAARIVLEMITASNSIDHIRFVPSLRDAIEELDKL